MLTMSLSTREGELNLGLPVCGRTEDVLAAQLARLETEAERSDFALRIAAKVDDCIAQCVEPGLRSPSKSQINIATRISSDLGINLTPDVLRYQEAMDAFLAAHQDKLSSLPKSPWRPAVHRTR
jgi:hypothetical protein